MFCSFANFTSISYVDMTFVVSSKTGGDDETDDLNSLISVVSLIPV